MKKVTDLVYNREKCTHVRRETNTVFLRYLFGGGVNRDKDDISLCDTSGDFCSELYISNFVPGPVEKGIKLRLIEGQIVRVPTIYQALIDVYDFKLSRGVLASHRDRCKCTYISCANACDNELAALLLL